MPARTDMSEKVSHLEASTRVRHRRQWSVAEKLRIVREAMQPDVSVSSVARKHRISPSLLFSWRRRIAERDQEAVGGDEELIGATRVVRELEERIGELERLLGRKTLEIENLKERLAAAHVKKPLLLQPLPDPHRSDEGRGRPIGVARSNLVEPAQQGGRLRSSR